MVKLSLFTKMLPKAVGNIKTSTSKFIKTSPKLTKSSYKAVSGGTTAKPSAFRQGLSKTGKVVGKSAGYTAAAAIPVGAGYLGYDKFKDLFYKTPSQVQAEQSEDLALKQSERKAQEATEYVDFVGDLQNLGMNPSQELYNPQGEVFNPFVGSQPELPEAQEESGSSLGTYALIAGLAGAGIYLLRKKKKK